MLAGGELAGAVDYQARWLVLAVCLLAAVVAWNLGVALWGRPPRRARPAHRRLDRAELRRSCLERIDTVVADHEAGRLDGRGAHQRLSALVREYVEAVDGAPVTSMTLARLRNEERPDLAGVLEIVTTAYPPSFAPDGPGLGDLTAAATRAREVVTSWR